MERIIELMRRIVLAGIRGYVIFLKDYSENSMSLITAFASPDHSGPNCSIV